MKYLLMLIVILMSKLILILCGLVALFIVYPIGVIVPFLWNFKLNIKGWMFEEFYFNDETDALVYIFDIYRKEERYGYLYEHYPTYFHFILALLLKENKKFRNLKHYELVDGKVVDTIKVESFKDQVDHLNEKAFSQDDAKAMGDGGGFTV